MSDASAFEELIKAISASSLPKRDDGMTTAELRQLTGKNEKWVRQQIRAGIAAGQIRAGKRPYTRIDGSPQMIPVYVLVRGGKR